METFAERAQESITSQHELDAAPLTEVLQPREVEPMPRKRRKPIYAPEEMDGPPPAIEEVRAEEGAA